jgi:serpin B
MVVLLPRKHDGLPELEQELTAANLEGWFKKFHKGEVQLALPKFHTESRIPVGYWLKAMGMPLAFNKSDADFTGMASRTLDGNLYISKVIHQTFVDVDEEGTEAAAATAVAMTVFVSEPIVHVFRADHPFVYLIRDTKTGNILFLGRYAGP